MPLTFKLSFEHFDFNDEEFLNDLKHVHHFLGVGHFLPKNWKIAKNRKKIAKSSKNVPKCSKDLTKFSKILGRNRQKQVKS